jgi:hypothetical protein
MRQRAINAVSRNFTDYIYTVILTLSAAEGEGPVYLISLAPGTYFAEND